MKYECHFFNLLELASWNPTWNPHKAIYESHIMSGTLFKSHNRQRRKFSYESVTCLSVILSYIWILMSYNFVTMRRWSYQNLNPDRLKLYLLDLCVIEWFINCIYIMYMCYKSDAWVYSFHSLKNIQHLRYEVDAWSKCKCPISPKIFPDPWSR